MDSTFEVGDIVAPVANLYSDDGYGSSHLCASKGERLTVHTIFSKFSYEVHKTSIKEPKPYDLFRVGRTELELVRSISEDTTNLVYSIVVESLLIGHDKAWERVAKILREFKKKKHKGFYLDVEEMQRNRGYKIKVYKEKQG